MKLLFFNYVCRQVLGRGRYGPPSHFPNRKTHCRAAAYRGSSKIFPKYLQFSVQRQIHLQHINSRLAE